MEQNASLTEELRKIIRDENISQKEIAKKLNYSQAAVNTYLNGKYEGNYEEFETALKRFLEHFKNKKAYRRAYLDFVKTSIAARFFNVASICHINSEIGLCSGAYRQRCF